jgi:hypothetical protein
MTPAPPSGSPKVDFQSTLNSLATATTPKVGAATAQTLTAEAQGVIDCINAIGTTDTDRHHRIGPSPTPGRRPPNTGE